jgi:hypothetical protein
VTDNLQATTQVRQEIRVLSTVPAYSKQFSLFIQALTNIKTPGYTQNGSDAPSWMQLGTRADLCMIPLC